ncbi:batten's disease protein Cln3 [Flagelloscypha sp. PMI_526]|nr:batten's disease protein Cln3 [Flagelloscypha sp. PMI_526]
MHVDSSPAQFYPQSGCWLLHSADLLGPRLLGISLASFSSGLGELSFLQLSTTYPSTLGGHAVGYFASGTGAAGLVGAFLWWMLRNLGIRLGVGMSSVLPIIIPATFFYLLPPSNVLIEGSGDYSEVPYSPIATLEEPGEEEAAQTPHKSVSLTLNDKWNLLWYTRWNIPSTLGYAQRSSIHFLPQTEHPILSKIFKGLRDYYPTWQLTYQAAVFVSRSAISLGMPPIKATLLPVPAYIQAVVLAILAFESGHGLFPDDAITLPVLLVFILVLVEGLCGGLAYVNVFYHINQIPEPNTHDLIRTQQEREFRIGSMGFSDSLGILTASLISIPTEVLSLSPFQHLTSPHPDFDSP